MNRNYTRKVEIQIPDTRNVKREFRRACIYGALAISFIGVCVATDIISLLITGKR